VNAIELGEHDVLLGESSSESSSSSLFFAKETSQFIPIVQSEDVGNRAAKQRKNV